MALEAYLQYIHNTFYCLDCCEDGGVGWNQQDELVQLYYIPGLLWDHIPVGRGPGEVAVLVHVMGSGWWDHIIFGNLSDYYCHSAIVYGEIYPKKMKHPRLPVESIIKIYAGSRPP